MRLAIERLCNHLGAQGKTLNDKIGDLVKNRSLDPKIQQALDTVRVVGNEAVHPGQFDHRDDAGTVEKMFGLVNVIAESMITVPKHVEQLYKEVVPEGVREQIRERDENG